MFVRTDKRILLVLPSLLGHRQIYASVISDWALKEDYSVFIATLENNENTERKAPLFNHIIKHKGIEHEYFPINCEGNTNSIPKGSLALVTVNLEKRIKPALTILPNADAYIDGFHGLGQMTQEIRPRRAAIMNKCHCFYPVQYFQLRTKVDHLSMIRYLRHWLMYLSTLQRERKILLKDYFKQLGLNRILTMDNRFYSHAKKDTRFRLIPEIYRTWGLSLPGESVLINSLQKEYSAFLDKNAGKEVLLFFGGWAARRGYDTLMKLACENTNCVFVGVGCPSGSTDYEYDLISLRHKLSIEGRIFERDVGFITNNAFVDSIFSSAKYVILPYKGFFLSSGALITAASYSKPVLVPMGGNMADQVRQFKIGLTYKHSDYSDLQRKFLILQRAYRNHITHCEQYASMYSRERVYEALSIALLS